MSNVFITGTTGHVGQVLYNYLNVDFEVISINRNQNSFTQEKNIYYDEIEKYLDANKINDDDTLVHVSSVIDNDNLNEEITYFNTFYTHKLLKLFKLFGLKKVILISSAPIPGYKDHSITENEFIEPITVYHLSKFYQEKLVELLGFENFYNLRISSPISPIISKSNIFKVFMDAAIKNDDIKILGKGLRSQNYIDVRDIAELSKSIIVNNFKSGTYNICSDVSISNINLAKTIIRIIDSKSKMLFIGEDKLDDQNWRFNISRAAEKLNFSPKIKIEKTIQDYYQNYK
jgi:nucleoside-diphosphate-sugar epimerase